MNAWIPKPECNIPFDLTIDAPKNRTPLNSEVSPMDRAANVSALKMDSVYSAVPNIVAGPMAYKILAERARAGLIGCVRM